MRGGGGRVRGRGESVRYVFSGVGTKGEGVGTGRMGRSGEGEMGWELVGAGGGAGGTSEGQSLV